MLVVLFWALAPGSMKPSVLFLYERPYEITSCLIDDRLDAASYHALPAPTLIMSDTIMINNYTLLECNRKTL